MAKVTGIGGVFFKSKGDHKALAEWYEKHLGIKREEWGGSVLRWEEDSADDKGLTVWSTAKSDTKWFSPSGSSFMINYRIDDMDGMIEQLKAGGVAIEQGPERHENGKFAWIMDPDGNKVELWEPKLWDPSKT
ncbi:MAG TPA: VOC family protein [Candidatus Kapabacteria bacterium]|nr:VOC family protein [Candidatus Kapabacteria bacterium]